MLLHTEIASDSQNGYIRWWRNDPPRKPSGDMKFREHDTVDIPEGFLEMGFTDGSWHNDAMPRLDMVLDERPESEDGPELLTLWVNYPADDREPGCEEPAYAVTHFFKTGDAPDIYFGDSADQAREAIRTFLKLRRPPVPRHP